MQHRRVREHLLRPPAAEVLGEAERTPAAEDAAVEVETRRRPAACAVGARWLDAARPTRDTGIDRDPRPDGDRAVRPRLDHAAGDLVTEDERECAGDTHERRGRTGVVSEDVQVAPADSADADLHARPGRSGKFGLWEFDERRRNRR